MSNPLVLDLVTRLHAEDKTAQEIASELMSRGYLPTIDLDTVKALQLGLKLPSQGKAAGSATAERKVFEDWRDAYYKKAAAEKQIFKAQRDERVKQETAAGTETTPPTPPPPPPTGAGTETTATTPPTPPTGTITPDKTRAQQALESDDLGRVYDELRLAQERTRLTAEDTPQLQKINAELNQVFDKARELRIARQKDEDAKVFDSPEQKQAKNAGYAEAMAEFDAKIDKLYEDKQKARGLRGADTPLIKQLRDKADELYAKKYPGLSTAEQAELELLYEQNAEIQARTDLKKKQK
jgi:hypothetical protein